MNIKERLERARELLGYAEITTKTHVIHGPEDLAILSQPAHEKALAEISAVLAEMDTVVEGWVSDEGLDDLTRGRSGCVFDPAGIFQKANRATLLIHQQGENDG